MERALNKKDVVIADAGNYIKGFRYQLYCIARALSTPHCVVGGCCERGLDCGTRWLTPAEAAATAVHVVGRSNASHLWRRCTNGTGSGKRAIRTPCTARDARPAVVSPLGLIPTPARPGTLAALQSGRARGALRGAQRG